MGYYAGQQLREHLPKNVSTHACPSMASVDQEQFALWRYEVVPVGYTARPNAKTFYINVVSILSLGFNVPVSISIWNRKLEIET